MNKLFLARMALLGLLAFLIISGDVFAANLKRRDTQGTLYYTCSRPGWVGEAKVLPRRDNNYEVFGPYFSGWVTTSSPKQAAAKACGELRNTQLSYPHFFTRD